MFRQVIAARDDNAGLGAAAFANQLRVRGRDGGLRCRLAEDRGEFAAERLRSHCQAEFAAVKIVCGDEIEPEVPVCEWRRTGNR